MATVKAAVIKKQTGCGFLVRPSVVFLTKEDEFWFVNTTDQTFTLGRQLKGPVGPHSSILVTVPSGLPLCTAIRYTVETSDGTKAKGDSDPVIIIDR